ncbi:MAG: PQQ-binding-like beta-propeller repeat protein [Planctomycetota bacterium]
MNKTSNLKTTLLQKSWLVCSVVALSSLFAASAWGNDWTRFRGPGGGGKVEATNLPVTWDAQKNIVWKTELPGLGTSSPIVLGTNIYLTCYSGYAESIREPGEMQELMRHLVCLDRNSGKILWSKKFTPKLPESKYRSGNESRHGYASSTLATDGKRLYAFFGISGVYGFDLDGNTLWNTDVGSGTHGWGSGTSPLLYRNLVIVNASVESESLIALDRDTGQIVWRTPGIKKCWSSPMLVQAGDQQELVLNVPHKLTGFDPDTGDELWHCDGIPDGYLCPTVITHEDVVFAIGGRKNTAIAVRAGGRDNVTQTHVLWTADKGSIVSSPVYLNGYLYWCHESRGKIYCLDAKTGNVVYEESLTPKPGLIYASITAADGKLYAPSREKGTYVLAAKPEFQQLAVNQFQDDPSRTNASMAVSNNQLIMRTDKVIYCIGL